MWKLVYIHWVSVLKDRRTHSSNCVDCWRTHSVITMSSLLSVSLVVSLAPNHNIHKHSPSHHPVMFHWSTQWKNSVGSAMDVFIGCFTHLPWFETITSENTIIHMMPGDSGKKHSLLMLSLYFISSAHHNNVGRDHKAWKCLIIYFLTTLLICRSDFLQPSYSNCILFLLHTLIYFQEETWNG